MSAKRMPGPKPAAGEPVKPRAWVNYPVKTQNAEFKGYGEPELAFERLSYGYDIDKAEPLCAGAAPVRRMVDVLMKLSQVAHTAAHMSEWEMRVQLADIADRLIALASTSKPEPSSADEPSSGIWLSVVTDTFNSLPASAPREMPALTIRQVSESEALRGGRWTSSDDVERVAKELHRAMHPNSAPPVVCRLADVVGEAVDRLAAAPAPAAPAAPLPDAGTVFVVFNGAKRRAVATLRENAEYAARSIAGASVVKCALVPLTLANTPEPASERKPYRCIKPHCPSNCSVCNHAIPGEPSAKLLIVELLDAFAKDGHGGDFEDGECELVDRARAYVSNTSAEPASAPSEVAVVSAIAEHIDLLDGQLDYFIGRVKAVPSAEMACLTTDGIRESLQAIRALTQSQASQSNEATAIALEALDWYANGNHRVWLHGRIDWVAARQRLTDAGFSLEGESYNGEESFVEGGRKAEEAAAAIRAFANGEAR